MNLTPCISYPLYLAQHHHGGNAMHGDSQAYHIHYTAAAKEFLSAALDVEGATCTGKWFARLEKIILNSWR